MKSIAVQVAEAMLAEQAKETNDQILDLKFSEEKLEGLRKNAANRTISEGRVKRERELLMLSERRLADFAAFVSVADQFDELARKIQALVQQRNDLVPSMVVQTSYPVKRRELINAAANAAAIPA